MSYQYSAENLPEKFDVLVGLTKGEGVKFDRADRLPFFRQGHTHQGICNLLLGNPYAVVPLGDGGSVILVRDKITHIIVRSVK